MSYVLSVLVPAYNEASTIARVLDALLAVELIEGGRMEVVIVDDGSSDGTGDAIRAYQQQYPQAPIRYFSHERNQGKGSALQTAIQAAAGEYLIVQDADLEYDPREFNHLLRPMLEGHADVVYGSRFAGHQPHRVLFFWHSIGNKVLTTLSNMFTDLNLTDMETCYKLFRAELLKPLRLEEARFGFEPEVTAKIAHQRRIRIYEVGISYYGRTYADGKKINWRDGLRAIYCILKYNLWAR